MNVGVHISSKQFNPGATSRHHDACANDTHTYAIMSDATESFETSGKSPKLTLQMKMLLIYTIISLVASRAEAQGIFYILYLSYFTCNLYRTTHVIYCIINSQYFTGIYTNVLMCEHGMLEPMHCIWSVGSEHIEIY